MATDRGYLCSEGHHIYGHCHQYDRIGNLVHGYTIDATATITTATTTATATEYGHDDRIPSRALPRTANVII